jgi:hypothetical protein
MSRPLHRHSSAGSAHHLGHPLSRAWACFVKTCRNGCAGLAVFASLAVVDPAHAESVDRWQPYPGVGLLDGVVLRIHWFDSAAALYEASENSGQKINEIGLKGFSILKRNTQTGEYVCDVYVVRMTGASVDGDRTKTFGHEVLHCFGLRHEEAVKARVR